MFSKAMVQRSTRLANVGAGAFGTWDAVHHSLSVVCWYWVLGVHMLLPQGPEGTEGNLDGPLIGGPRPYGGFRQSTDVGESHRSTGLAVRSSRQSGCGQVCIPLSFVSFWFI